MTSTHFRLAAFSVIVLVAANAAPAGAQSAPDLNERVGDWVVVDQLDYGTIYIDTAHVEPVDPGVYNVRTRWSFADVQTNPEGDRYRSSVALRAVNCTSQEMAIVAYADLDGERVVKTTEQPMYAVYWFNVSPASILEQIASRTCELGRRGGRLVSAGSEG